MLPQGKDTTIRPTIYVAPWRCRLGLHSVCIWSFVCTRFVCCCFQQSPCVFLRYWDLFSVVCNSSERTLWTCIACDWRCISMHLCFLNMFRMCLYACMRCLYCIALDFIVLYWIWLDFIGCTCLCGCFHLYVFEGVCMYLFVFVCFFFISLSLKSYMTTVYCHALIKPIINCPSFLSTRCLNFARISEKNN